MLLICDFVGFRFGCGILVLDERTSFLSYHMMWHYVGPDVWRGLIYARGLYTTCWWHTFCGILL